MKLRKMLYGLILLMLGCFVLASCVNDEEGPCLPDGETRVLFSLELQDNAQTRAGTETWNSYNPKETGVAYDNYIDLANVQMLLFTAAGNYVGKLGDLTYSKTGENIYQYIGTAPKDANQQPLSAGEYKFVVLANCADAGLTVGTTTIPASTIADLDTKAFNLFADSGNTEYIPMWGILKTNLTLVAGNRQELGTISLLRAMSKVTVKLEAKEGATGDPLRGYSLEKVTLSNYNKSGYIVPTGASTAATTKELNLDASLNVKADPGTNKEFTAGQDAKELTFYLPEYKNVETGDETEEETVTPAVLTVYLTKTVGEGESATTLNFNAPLEFCEYADGVPAKDPKPYNIIRNHWYQFNIYSVSDDGALYVKPTVADWEDATPLDYTIKMSTNMRLFDSWLYRYDTDGDVTPTNYTNWATSHMMVSSGRVETPVAPETIAGRPLHSPQIQLLTTGVYTFNLTVDNSDFEIVRANKNTTGVVTSYDTSTDGTLTIPAGDDVYTYFYIVPKEGVTPANPEAKVSLFYNDTVLGQQKVTYNNNSLPGYSDDSSEIWVYYVVPDDYKLGTGVLKMYYQDSSHPLVPTPVQN